MRGYIIASVLALSVASGGAFAQTSQSSTTTTPPDSKTGSSATGSSATGSSASGSSTAGSSTTPSATPPAGMQATSSVVVKFVSMQPADVLSSRLIGTDVHNAQNETVGEIEDLVINNGKTVSAVVIGVGGFLGMGERYVAVDPGSIVLTRQGDSWRAVMNTTKDNLKAAPEFKYTRR